MQGLGYYHHTTITTTTTATTTMTTTTTTTTTLWPTGTNSEKRHKWTCNTQQTTLWACTIIKLNLFTNMNASPCSLFLLRKSCFMFLILLSRACQNPGKLKTLLSCWHLLNWLSLHLVVVLLCSWCLTYETYMALFVNQLVTLQIGAVVDVSVIVVAMIDPA